MLRTLNGRKKVRVLLDYGSRSRFIDIWYNPRVFDEDCHFYYDENTCRHYFKICFEGDSKVKADIRPLHSDTILLEKTINSGDVIELEDEAIDEKIKFLKLSKEKYELPEVS